ncbi:dynamin family protein [Pseudanabaena galeata UHCC 0370]|uniref:Dynamin family protein n=1 Tax=Pseudanabaena galeata UHCC 0370 TaxID=3110310 RepID=A0ABU5TQB8_9CYAN|nr:dynamin family protein [Pseudanabaena galeata]MEA5480467.1 dynamin family protein [Pseudanabaena galeata UHCC 0370]
MFDDIFSTLHKNASDPLIAVEQTDVKEEAYQSEDLNPQQVNDSLHFASEEIINVDEYIESWIKNCLSLAETISCDDVITKLTELDVRWQLPGFRLAFVGEFSRGKSTLINRLLGRDLLPIGARPTTGTLISIVAGETEKMEICPPDKGWEVREMEESSWTDLLASEQNETDQEKLTRVRLTLDHPWLKAIDVELIDTPGAGDLNSNRTALLSDLLSRCDAAVILVSATLPFSITEASFLDQEVLSRHIPNVLVAVSKLDTVPQEQKAELFNVIRERVMAISTKISIIPIHPLDVDASEVDALETVKTQIEAIVEKGERKIWRSWKVANQLVDYLNHIAELSETAIKAAHMSAMEKEQALRQLEQEKAISELHWEDIRLNIDRRRLQHSQRLRQKVLQAKDEIIEIYSFDLKKSKDLKSWWESDLPFKLRRELLSLGNKLGEEMLSELSQDFEWVQNEVSRRYSRQISRNSSNVPSTVKPELYLNQIQLTDIRNYAILTKLASSATTVCGYIFGGPTGAVISALAWGLSEQFIHQKTDEQRRRLSEELILNLDRIADEYYNQISQRLKELYNHLIEEMRQEEKVWQSAWDLTLRKSANTQDTSCYSDLIKQVVALKQEIYSALSR